jgi:hypothetical protein
MAELPMQIVAPDRRRHMDGMVDLIAKVFSVHGYYNFRNRCRRWYVGNSHYDWAASRIGVRDGRVVTHYGVWGYEMRIGSAAVKVGGIGVVATDGDCRKQGLMAKTIPHSIGAMRELGYDLSILFGISDFYDKFGYVRAWTDESWYIRTSDLPAGAAVRPLRFRLKARQDLAELYNREQAGLTATAVRPTYTSTIYPDRGEQLGYLWRDGRGRIAGYVVVRRDGNRLHCTDAVGDVEQVFWVIGMLARKWSIAEIHFDAMHYQSGLCRRLRQLNCRYERRYNRCGGPMVRTINLRQCLGKMAAELGRRLMASELRGWRGRLLIAGANKQAVLEIDRAKVMLVEQGGGASRRGMKIDGSIRGGDHIAQLLIGTDDPGELVESAGMRLRGEAGRLLPVLFPDQHPQLHVADRY